MSEERTMPGMITTIISAEVARLTQSLADRERRIERLTDALREAKHRFTNIQRSSIWREIAQIGEAELEDVLIPAEGDVEVRAARGEWQPIETAPKDGRRVRLLIPYNRSRFSEAECTDEGYWEPLSPGAKPSIGLGIPAWGVEQGGCWRFDGDDGGFDIQPTHWQPLPAPPLSRAQHGPSQNPDQEKTE